MIRLIGVCAIVAIFILSMYNIAEARELGEVGETIYDTARGVNGSCPLTLELYVAKTLEDATNLPLVGKADVRIKLGYEFDSHKLTGDNQLNLSAGLEF